MTRAGPTAVLLAAALAWGAAVPPQDTGSNEAYGATPEALAPYRASGPAYWRFFTEPVPFRGSRVEHGPPGAAAAARIGLVVPSAEGPDARIGQAMRRGVELCLEQANALGGWRGRVPYELVLREAAATWGAASNTMVDLAWTEGVRAVLGSLGAADTHVALRVALRAQVPMVNTACTDPTLTETAIPWLLRCYPDDRQHGYRLARLIFEQRGLQRVAVLRANDKFGRMGVAELTDAARRLGRPIVLELRYEPGETSFEPQVERLARAGLDGVVLWSAATDAGNIVLALRRAGVTAPVFGTDRLVSEAFLAAAGDAAEGVLATSPLDPTRPPPGFGPFAADFEQRFGQRPDAFAAFSYDGARLLLDAMERAGLARADIRDALAGLSTYEGVSGPMRFDATHNNLGTLHVLEVRDGRFAPVVSR